MDMQRRHGTMTLSASVVLTALLASALLLTVRGSESVRLALDRRQRFRVPAGRTAVGVQSESVLGENGAEEPVPSTGKAGAMTPGVNANLTLYCDERCDGPSNWSNCTVGDAEATLAFETAYANGTRTLTKLRVDEAMVEYVNGWMRGERARRPRPAGAKSRRRRAVLELDSRFEVNVMQYLTAYPFSAAVKISTGCTGVLVGEKHVLTAAHCLHDGRRYTVPVRQVRVGFRRDRPAALPGEDPEAAEERAFVWIRAEKAFLPYEWTNSARASSPGLLPLDRDYAVLLLRRSPERAPLPLGIGDLAGLPAGTMVHFASFDRPDRPALFYRYCTVTGGSQELFYQRCDAEPSSVGAGVYVRQWDPEEAGWSRRVVGLFGGHSSFRDASGQWLRDQNVAMRITPLKFAQICYWVTGNYGGCDA